MSIKNCIQQWPELTLNDVCLKITDGAHLSPKSVESGLPMASVKDLTTYGINMESCRLIAKEDFDKLVGQGCQPLAGDVLIAKDGASALDTVCVVKTTLDVVLLSSVAILRPNKARAVPSFLYYCLDSKTTRSYMKNAFTTGAAIPRVVLKDFKQVRIKVPPLITQRKIAAILSAYDDLIENNLRRIKILEKMAQNTYFEWFVKYRFPGYQQAHFAHSTLGRIPEGWEVKTIGNVTSNVNRGISPKYDDSSSSIVINQKCIRDHKLDLELARRHSSRIATDKQVDFGDVLINSTGVGTLGRVAQVYVPLSDTTVDSHVSIVRPQNIEDVDYLGLTLIGMQSKFEMLGVGATGQTELSRDRISKTEVLLPPLDLRKLFSSMVGPIRKQVVNLLLKNVTLRRTRDLLLPRLISGVVDVSGLDIAIPEVTV